MVCRQIPALQLASEQGTSAPEQVGGARHWKAWAWVTAGAYLSKGAFVLACDL